MTKKVLHYKRKFEGDKTVLYPDYGGGYVNLHMC